LENNCSSNKGGKAKFFSDNFSLTFCTPNVADNNSFNDLNESIELFNCNLSVAEVFEALSNIGFNPSPGPDSIPPLFYTNVVILYLSQFIIYFLCP